MVTVNGNTVPSTDGETLINVLARCGFSGSRIAVEVNGDIVPKSQHSTYRTSVDDRIEVVGLVGGG